MVQAARLAKWNGDRLEIKYKVAVMLMHAGVRIPYLAPFYTIII